MGWGGSPGLPTASIFLYVRTNRKYMETSGNTFQTSLECSRVSVFLYVCLMWQSVFFHAEVAQFMKDKTIVSLDSDDCVLLQVLSIIYNNILRLKWNLSWGTILSKKGSLCALYSTHCSQSDTKIKYLYAIRSFRRLCNSLSWGVWHRQF